jgi:hypothetical protein
VPIEEEEEDFWVNYEYSTDWLDEGDIIYTRIQRYKCGSLCRRQLTTFVRLHSCYNNITLKMAVVAAETR